MKNIVILVLGLIIIIGGVYILTKDSTTEYAAETKSERNTAVTTSSEETMPTEETEKEAEEREEEQKDESETVIGTSADGRDVVAYHYGEGETELVFIGGIHGGYAWNTVLVARELMEYLEDEQGAIPENIKVTVIPILNPDGLASVVGTDGVFDASDVSSSQETIVAGRFNDNDVDLNRNFACDWQAKGTWKNQTVSGGDEAFSEPESQAVRDYIEKNEPTAVVAWYSAAGGVYTSNCHKGVSPETSALTNIYADASGYPAYEAFDFYEVTGDMVNWLAKKRIPAISVLLTNHEDVEWDKNKKGVDAILKHYAE